MSFWVKKRNDNARLNGQNRSRGPSLRPPPPESEAPAPKDERDENTEEEKKEYTSSRATLEEMTKGMDLMDTEEEEWYAEMGQNRQSIGRIRMGTVSGAPPPPTVAAPASTKSYGSYFNLFARSSPPPLPKKVAKPIKENTDPENESPSSPGIQNLTPGIVPLQNQKSKKNLVRINTNSVWEEDDVENLHDEMAREMIRLKSMSVSASPMVDNSEGENANDVDLETPEAQPTLFSEPQQPAFAFTPEVDPNLGQPIFTKKTSAFGGPKKGTTLVGSVEDTEDTTILSMSL